MKMHGHNENENQEKLIQFDTLERLKNDNIPTKRQVLKLMKNLGLHRNILRHQSAVMREAREIAHNISKVELNIDLIVIGALIHDIGRIKTHTLEHGPIGGDIIRSYGFSEKLARIAERHSMAGLTREEAIKFDLPDRIYQPETIEEKIVCLADKYYISNKKVSIQERFNKWIEKYGETPFLKEHLSRALQIEEEILRLIF